MTFAEGLFAILSTHAPLTALVPASRIGPWPLRQNAPLPSITYSVAGGDVAYAFGEDPNIRQPRVQLDVWDTDYARAYRITESLRSRVANYRGDQTDGSVLLRFQGSFIQIEPMHLYEFDPAVHRLLMDVTFHYSVISA